MPRSTQGKKIVEKALKEMLAVSSGFGCIRTVFEVLLKDLPAKRRIARFNHRWERDPVTQLYVR